MLQLTLEKQERGRALQSATDAESHLREQVATANRRAAGLDHKLEETTEQCSTLRAEKVAVETLLQSTSAGATLVLYTVGTMKVLALISFVADMVEVECSKYIEAHRQSDAGTGFGRVAWNKATHIAVHSTSCPARV